MNCVVVVVETVSQYERLPQSLGPTKLKSRLGVFCECKTGG